MRNFITVLFSLCIHLSAWSQKSITTDVPCTGAMAQNAKGRWMKHPGYDMSTNAEANKRMDEIHNLFLKIYPQAIGVDALLHRRYGLSYFGAKRKYSQTENGLRSEDLNLPHFNKYYYKVGFFYYWCDQNKSNIMWTGYPGETGSTLTITANAIEGSVGGVAGDDTCTINGLPVRMRPPRTENHKGI